MGWIFSVVGLTTSLIGMKLDKQWLIDMGVCSCIIGSALAGVDTGLALAGR